MRALSVIFVIFGLLFIGMGFCVEPMFPAICMAILFFAIAILFWRNQYENWDPRWHDDMGIVSDNKKTPSETFKENKKLLEKIKELRNKK